MQWIVLICIVFLVGCGDSKSHIQTKILSPVCIKPFYGYHYKVCHDIKININGNLFIVPAGFETDLANIPKIFWPILSPAHSSLIQASIVHDFFYRMTCDFDRYNTDLIFYHMLRNDDVNLIQAKIMFYAVRLFGWQYYNEDYCI